MSRAMTSSLAAALVGAAVLLVGVFVAPQDAAASYLYAYTAIASVAVGMLLLVMVARLSGAVWFVVLRKQAEAVVAALPALAVLALPLVTTPHAFWPWAAPFATLPSSLQEALRPKLWYLNPIFFGARTILYWAIWLTIGERLLRLSRDSAHATPQRWRVTCAAGAPFAVLALTFAAFDWMMSLSPAWSSTVYGAYYSAGAMVSALALLAIQAARHREALSLTTEHFQAIGRLTLAFLLFWAYLWYTQFFVVWIADLPQEVPWYAIRLQAGWHVVTRVLVAAGFVAPFLVLLVRSARGSARVMRIVGVWLLAAHLLDVYWLVKPSAAGWRPWSSILDVAAILFVAGLAAAASAWRQGSSAILPTGDPLLEPSLRYEAH